ncbi:MAG: 1-deoxy-D-xylulose-5-phosphate reductoisomerase [Ignavibacteria bacterium]|nr:1-deoxy-D-xylulose-5-phosphate reductoisomerase [Ignavibacteria bacterium]
MITTVRGITVLGSTGSIGTQTLNVIQQHANLFSLRFLTCNTRVEDLAKQVEAYKPYGVAIREEEAWKKFKLLCPNFSGPILCGEKGLCEAASDSETNIVMSAMVGFSGVVPTMAAISSGKTICLANKETLVSAGEIITSAAHKHKAPLLAVDSEHSAIAQCLVGEDVSSVERIILTASGGPFKDFTVEQLKTVTPQQALQHPNWDMGAKITIDCATLMNKGFEVIEARWLFGLHADQIDVVVHPQSIIHSMVQFVDGSLKAQLGVPSMLVPIQYALLYPHRLPLQVDRVNFTDFQNFTFEPVDTSRFPCLQIAYDVMSTGGNAPCIANAANEIAVQNFLKGAIGFTDIPKVIEYSLLQMEVVSNPSLAAIIETDIEARRIAASWKKH